jgi:hypothetical protein
MKDFICSLIVAGMITMFAWNIADIFNTQTHIVLVGLLLFRAVHDA